MIYKVFYQETKERNPRREQTKALYLEIDAANELEGRIKTRKLVEEKTPYNLSLIHISEPTRHGPTSRMPSSA